MKNKYQESLIRSGKKIGPMHLNQEGVYSPYLYEGGSPIFWYSSFGFRFGAQWVEVSLSHPRDIYRDALRKIVDDLAGPYPDDDWLEVSSVNYVRAGNSRKRVVSRTTTFPEKLTAYYDHYNAVEERVFQGGVDISVRPFIEIIQRAWGRQVVMCCPLDIFSEENVNFAALMTKAILRPGYRSSIDFMRGVFPLVYTRENWLVDWPIEKAFLESKRANNGELE